MLRKIAQIDLENEIQENCITLFKLNEEKLIIQISKSKQIIVQRPNNPEQKLSKITLDQDVINIGSFEQAKDQFGLLVVHPFKVLGQDIRENFNFFDFTTESEIKNAIYKHSLMELRKVIVTSSDQQITLQDIKGKTLNVIPTKELVSDIYSHQFNKKECIIFGAGNNIIIHDGLTELLTLNEISPIEKFTISKGLLASTLMNGNLCIYTIDEYNLKRLWRTKHKSKVSAVEILPTVIYNTSIDEPKVLVGQENGKFEIRAISNGKLDQKMEINKQICYLSCYDFRNLGYQEILVFTSDGQLLVHDINLLEIKGSDTLELQIENKKKQLKQLYFEESKIKSKFNSLKNKTGTMPMVAERINIRIEYEPDFADGSVDLVVKTEWGYIRQIFIIGNNIFPEKISKDIEQCYLKQNTQFNPELKVKFKPFRDEVVDVVLRIMVASKITDKQFVILNRGCQLPLFCMQSQTKKKESSQDTKNSIRVECLDKITRIVNFLVNNFVLSQEDVDMMTDKDNTFIKAEFMNMRNRNLIGLDVTNSKDTNTVKITLYTTNLDFCVKFFKEYMKENNISDTKITYSLPDIQTSTFEDMNKVIKLMDAKNNLALETAEKIVGTKDLVVKLQNEISSHNWQVVQGASDDIFQLNGYLLEDFSKRKANYEQLSGLLKKVNQNINLISELQNANKNEFINKCRQAIKNQDLDMLNKILIGDALF